MDKILSGSLSFKVLAVTICNELIVNENNVIINNIKNLETFTEAFKSYLIYNFFTNIEQVDKYTFRYKFNNKMLTLKEGY